MEQTLIALVITLLALGFVGMPLLRERKPEEDLDYEDLELDPEIDRLLSKKETALAAIRELEYDHAAGSLSDEDYLELKEKYERRAIALLKEIDEVGEVGSNGYHDDEGRRAVRMQRPRRGHSRKADEFACPECGEPYEEGDAFCASCGAQLSFDEEEFACPECGEPYEEGDAFCVACGAQLGSARNRVEPEVEEDGAESQMTSTSGEAIKPSQSSGASQRKRNRRGRNRRASSGSNGKGIR